MRAASCKTTHIVGAFALLASSTPAHAHTHTQGSAGSTSQPQASSRVLVRFSKASYKASTRSNTAVLLASDLGSQLWQQVTGIALRQQSQ
jgi:hypothetical protein